MLRSIVKTCQSSNVACQLQKVLSAITPPTHIRYATTVANSKSTTDDTKLEQVHIAEAIKMEPTLAAISPEMWRRAHETFLNHGLHTTSFLRIVTSNPALLTRPPKKIIEALEHWRACQFGEPLLHLLVTKYPELLDVTDGRRLLQHVTYLKSFAGTNKNIWKLLMNCPNLMEQSKQSIEEKIAYLTLVMRIQVPEIVKSEALSKPLHEIRCRHVFLERLGLFKPRSLKADPDEPTKNHRLYQITDTSEKAFATKICHVSLAEYEVFKELYEREFERKQRQENPEEDDDFSDEEQQK